MGKKASHQRAKNLKYKKLNKAFSRKKTRVILYEPSDSDSSSSSESPILKMKTRKPPSPTTQSPVTTTKSATALPTSRKKSETMVAEMNLSSIK